MTVGDCDTADQIRIICVWDAPLRAGEHANPLVLETTIDADAPAGDVTNQATVTNTLDDPTDNNTDGGTITIITSSGSNSNSDNNSAGQGLLPRTGAGIIGMLAVALALLAGGHTLLGATRKRQHNQD